MKRRPRLQAKPVIPLKEGVSKPVADFIASDSTLASGYRSLAVSASVQVSNSTNEADGLVFTEERNILEVAAKSDTLSTGVFTKNADSSALELFRFNGNVAQEKNKEEKVCGNLITPGKQESVSSADQNLSEPNLNGASRCQAVSESDSDATASQVCHSVTVPEMEMSAECHLNDQNLEASVPSEKCVYRQLIEECKESPEAGLEGSGPPQKRRRFIRKQPNVVKNILSCTSVSTSASVSSIESTAEVESPVPPPLVESASGASLGDVNSGNSPVSSVAMDAADNCKVPPESAKSVDGLEISHSVDTVDCCKSPLPVPMSPPVFSPKVRHHFTKVRPNLANCLTSKHSTPSDRLPKVSASTVDDRPFIPPPIAASRSAMCGLEEGVATEESVVVLPETVEKAAAKLIARKLKQKKKKRALENLDAPIDSSKVCMRDLIYMNPVNNPMKKSKVAESASNDSVKSAAAPKKPPTPAPAVSPAPVAAPQLKIGPDGSIIINEASLVIERQPVPKFDHTEAIDETDDMRCGYPKRSRTRSWSKKETRKFFAALSMIGTDFFLMMNLFPGRTRAELKRKFKREEKVHQAMVETALNDRRSLDMSLMAIHSSDEEETKPKGRQAGKRCPRANKTQPLDGSADKGKVLGGKENDPQPVSVVKKEQKRKREKEKEKQPGKKQKKKKSRYYEESSDEGEEETEEQFESGAGDAESTVEEEDDHRTIAKAPSPHLSDEDEVEIVSCFSRRPTRSGRVPKPVKTYNPVKFSDLEASAADFVPATKSQSLTAKRKPESFKLHTTIPSPARSAGLMSPPHAPFMSPTRVPCSSPRALCSPLPFLGSPSPYGSPAHAPVLSPLVSCSPSSQMSLLTASIPGLENVPPGKQLMIVASPVMPGEIGEPPQQLLHVFMVSSPAVSSDTCNNGQDPMPMESTPNGNCVLGSADSGLVAHSSNNRTREHCMSDGNISTVANHKSFNPSQVTSDSCTFSPSGFRTPIPTRSNIDSMKSESFGTDTSRVSAGTKLDETLVSTLFPGRHQNDSTSFDRTLGTNGSVSPILSTSALEYCISQVTNVAPASLRFSEGATDHDSVDEDDIELEGNITDVVQQDDGTLVIIAESANVISSNGVPEMPSTDPGSDVKSQSTESVEVPLEKDSDAKGGGTEQIPLNRGEKQREDPKAVDVKFEFGTDENGNEDMDDFIEVFIETMPDLGLALGTETLSGTETTSVADILSCAAKTAAEEGLSDKVECRKELMLTEKCISGYAESVAEKCVSGDLSSVDAFDISKSSEPNGHLSRLECAVVLPSTANESIDVSNSLEPLNNVAKETSDIDCSSGQLLHNNNNTNNNRFLNVVSLPDGSIEIVLDNGAWNSEGVEQEYYVDLDFPFLGEQDSL